jgi:oxygen-independent coproporphyrinogen-3 oxidase
VRRGQEPPVDEEKAIRQFEYLMSAAAGAGYEHYEISNFALPGRFARHNSNYWKGKPYLGIGPSAHSYNGVSRQWNVANNAQYMKAIGAGNIPSEQETLTPVQRYNEYVMTRLRTIWGCEWSEIQSMGDSFANHFKREIRPFLNNGQVLLTDNKYTLSQEGKFLSDRIAVELFLEN